MTEATKVPEEAPHFETNTVKADRAIEQGLGVGARELAAQRDPGDPRDPDMDTGDTDDDALDQSLGVQGGKPDDRTPTGG